MSNGDSPTEPLDTMAALTDVIWDKLFEYAQEDLSGIDPAEVTTIRNEVKCYFLGEDDIIVPDNALVEKVSDGYWVEARIWVDAEYADA